MEICEKDHSYNRNDKPFSLLTFFTGKEGRGKRKIRADYVEYDEYATQVNKVPSKYHITNTLCLVDEI
jgi:hypothetical protein